MEKRARYWLLAIFIITIVIRLILAFSIPNFTHESYYHLRHVEYITDNGFPLFNDDLSYGGRELHFLPFFHYLMAGFDLILPLEIAAKIIPNLLLASLVIIVYLIANKITNNKSASLLSALTTGFLPILFSTNSFTPETLFLPLVFLTIYAFLKIREKKFLYVYILSFLLASLTSPATFLIIIGFGIYLLLSIIEGKRVTKLEIETIIFSLFFFIWVQFIFFKNSLLTEGISFVWQNIPSKIIQEYFPSFSISQALLLVSLVPFLAGIFIVYRSLFHIKNKKSFLLISLAISTTLLAWLRLIQFKFSLSFFAVILAILFSLFYVELKGLIRKSKAYHFQRIISIGLITILILTIIPPAISVSLQQTTPDDSEIAAFKWIADNIPEEIEERDGQIPTEEDSQREAAENQEMTPKKKEVLILSSLAEGHLVTYYGKRKNFMDDKFELVEDVEKRFNDVNLIFTTSLQTRGLRLLNEHGISYIIMTPHVKKTYNVPRLKYHSNECFERVYSEGEIKIYKVECGFSKIGNEE